MVIGKFDSKQMNKATIGKFGDVIGVVIPEQVLKEVHFTDGEQLLLHINPLRGVYFLGKRFHSELNNYSVKIVKLGDSFGFQIDEQILNEFEADFNTVLDFHVIRGEIMFGKLLEDEPVFIFAEDIKLKNGTVIEKGTEAGEYLKFH